MHTRTENKISIIVVGLNKIELPNSNYITYRTVKSFKGFCSKYSDFFNEIIASYWMWKNIDSDYYGIFHYRRFLSFKKDNNKRLIRELKLDDNFFVKYGLDDDTLQSEISKYDIIVPYPKNLIVSNGLFTSIYKQYKHCYEHDIKDLDNAIKILHELYPKFDSYTTKAMKMKKGYFNNIFIMKKKYFRDYCEWLFPILLKVHESKDYSNSSNYNKRTPGFIAERLFTVYMLYLVDKYKDIKIKECPLICVGSKQSFNSGNKKGRKLKISEFSRIGKLFRFVYHTIIGK